MRNVSTSVGTPCAVALAAGTLLLTAPDARAIDGPGVNTISNASWGGPGDIWPHVVRLEIDSDGNGLFDDMAHCTGTLIAPDIIATAGHCFNGFLGSNANIPANRVRVNFGAGASTQYINNIGGKTDNVTPKIVGNNVSNDFALVFLNGTAPVSPIPILPRAPRVGDTNYAIGFGSHTPNNAGNAQRQEVTVGNYFQHNAGAKNWATITVDAVTNTGLDANGDPTGGFIEQNQLSPDNWTEAGDSGGPGIQRITTMPDRAWGSTISNLAKGDFVMSAVSGGLTPTTNDSSNAANVNYPANPGSDDFWTRLDAERNFIRANSPATVRPSNVSIFHNLPDDISTIQPGDEIAVFVRANFPLSTPNYLLNINVWEEDNQAANGAFGFNGDVRLGNTEFQDDMAGFGFSAGSFQDFQTDVVAWDIRPASALIPFDEAGNALDPPLDWVFQINYGDALQFTNTSAEVTHGTFNDVMTQINNATLEVNNNVTVRGGFALVPEPTSIVLFTLLVGVGTGTRAGNRRPAV